VETSTPDAPAARPRRNDEQRQSAKERQRAAYQADPEKYRAIQRAYRARNAEKCAARQWVSNEIQAGRLIRPTHCPKCGRVERVEAHHPDHSKPSEIEWLCRVCHFGEPNHSGEAVSERGRANAQARWSKASWAA